MPCSLIFNDFAKGGDRMKLFYIKDDQSEKIDDISVFSKQRRAKIEAASESFQKLQQKAAAKLLQVGFGEWGIDERDLEYVFNEHGKPYAKGVEGLWFSLSHTKGMCCAVFAESEVGLDCESSYRRIPDRVIKRFFDADEVSDFQNDPVLLWCAKESLSKLYGVGISCFKRLEKLRNFKETLCLSEAYLKRIEIQDFTVVVSSFNNIEEIKIKEVII